MTPANGASDVDPGLGAIRVVFDRPMAEGSWSMVGSGPHFPEIVGKPSYDSKRTCWTARVRLKPAWEYTFWLNRNDFLNFSSAEGVPLEPVEVRFKTGRERAGTSP